MSQVRLPPEVWLLVSCALPVRNHPVRLLCSIFSDTTSTQVKWQTLPASEQGKIVASMLRNRDLPALRWAFDTPQQFQFPVQDSWIYLSLWYYPICVLVEQGELEILQLLASHSSNLLQQLSHFFCSYDVAIANGHKSTVVFLFQAMEQAGVDRERLQKARRRLPLF